MIDVRPVTAMNLRFANPIGLAAGYDRTGKLVSSLLSAGFGHIEVGTLSRATEFSGPLVRPSGGVRLGMNIGSERSGVGELVIEDFVAMLNQVASMGDYVVANLGAPALGRDESSPGIERLVQRLSMARDSLSTAYGRRTPLLLKLKAPTRGTPIPIAIAAARSYGLDGIVLVSDCLHRINEISRYVDGLTVISVGGIRTSNDVHARLAAGASLVQVHSAFAEGGMTQLLRILRGGATPTASSINSQFSTRRGLSSTSPAR
jgi:dihydroorotate dehydrogenase